MLEEPELLILDEPTNHLDLDTKGIVEDVFESYDGPIIFISHDRYFINKVATKIVNIDQKVTVFDGNYTAYAEHMKQLANEKKETIKPKSDKPINKEKEIQRLVKEIEEYEYHLEPLKKQLFDKEIYMDHELYQQKEAEIQSVEGQIESLYKEIENLSKT